MKRSVPNVPLLSNDPSVLHTLPPLGLTELPVRQFHASPEPIEPIVFDDKLIEQSGPPTIPAWARKMIDAPIQDIEYTMTGRLTKGGWPAEPTEPTEPKLDPTRPQGVDAHIDLTIPAEPFPLNQYQDIPNSSTLPGFEDLIDEALNQPANLTEQHHADNIDVRDEFALVALAEVIKYVADADKIADIVYNIADACMKRRKQRQ